MGVEYYFLFGCLSVLVLITVGLIINTCISGSKYFRSFQFLMSAMSYNKEADTAINLLLDKTEAGILIAKLSPSDDTIMFVNPNDEETTLVANQYRTSHADPRYVKVLNSEGEIWIGSKYYAYGYIHRYYGQRKDEFYKKRPSLNTFKRILKLEHELKKPSSENAAPNQVHKRDSDIVEL